VSDTADIVVIGAGVIGTSIAAHLAERDAGRIVLLERDSVASGASGRSSALVRMHYTFAPEVRLAVKSLEYFRDWKARMGRPTHFRVTGFVRIVSRAESDHLRANVLMQNACGAEARVITAAELRELAPSWNVDDVEVAAYEPGSGYGDGATVATDFLDRARELGVDYRPGTRIEGIDVEGGRVSGVRTASGTLASRRVVVAAGAWSGSLFSDIGVELPLETDYHEVIVLERPPEIHGSHLACIDSSLLIYFRSEGRTQSLLGDFYGVRGLDPDKEQPRPSVDTLEEKLQLFAKRVPAMEDAGIVRIVTGTYILTPDYRGLMGAVPEVDGLYCCTGFSGMGFKIAPAVGLVMSEILLDGRATTVDVSDFRPERFREGKPIRARFDYEND